MRNSYNLIGKKKKKCRQNKKKKQNKILVLKRASDLNTGLSRDTKMANKYMKKEKILNVTNIREI